MKTAVLILISMMGLAACTSIEENISRIADDSTNYTTIHWIDSVKDIGVVNAGTKNEIKFRFKNTGSRPLYIIAARPGCGCTIAEYPKEAIAINAEGEIKAEFNVTKGMTGEFRKNISVITNTKGTTSHNIFFYGKITKKDANQVSENKAINTHLN